MKILKLSVWNSQVILKYIHQQLELHWKLLQVQVAKNQVEMSTMVWENFEITCLKWLKHHTCALIKPSVTSENFSFFSSLIFVSGNLCSQIQRSEMLPKMVKNGVKSEFYSPFLTPILMISLFTYALHSWTKLQNSFIWQLIYQDYINI